MDSPNNYKLNVTEKCVEILDRDNNVICECFVKNHKQEIKKIIFFKNNNVDHVLYHTYETEKHTQFPEIEIVNLQTKEKKTCNPCLKMGYRTALIDEIQRTIILSGYVGGMLHSYVLYDFELNELSIGDYVDNKYLQTDMFRSYDVHNFTFENCAIYLNLIFKKIYLDQRLYPIERNFNLDTFVDCNDRLCLRCYDCTNKIDYANLEEIKLVVQFINECESYDNMKQMMKIFENNSNNIFKTFVLEENNESITKKCHNNKNLANFLSLSSVDVKNIQCNGFYTNNNYQIHWTNFLKYKFVDMTSFCNFLAQNTLGFSYHINKCIKKNLLPNGIGLVFKFTTYDNTTYKFVILMSLIEIEGTEEYVTYSKEFSKIKIEISAY